MHGLLFCVGPIPENGCRFFPDAGGSDPIISGLSAKSACRCVACLPCRACLRAPHRQARHRQAARRQAVQLRGLNPDISYLERTFIREISVSPNAASGKSDFVASLPRPVGVSITMLHAESLHLTARYSCGRGAPTPRGMHCETEKCGVRAPPLPLN